MVARAWVAAAALVLGAATTFADEARDAWAPGASAEPWPLIASLQRPGALGADRGAWRQAFEHADPLVRAAAAWAAGRTQPPEAAALLGVTAFDTDQIVREASLWALLRLDDPAALPHVWRVLATRRELTRRGASPSIRHLGEPPAGFATLFRWRGLPFVDGGIAYRREWRKLVSPEAIELTPGDGSTRSGIQTLDWTTERSEWDASERVTIRAEVVTAPARRDRPPSDGALPLQTSLVALDEPDSGPGHHEEPLRIPVRLRGVRSDDRDALPLRQGERTTVELRLSLYEIPPGPYALEPFETGHPLLLRVRRSGNREDAVQAAAASARTPDEIDAVSRQRVAAQADRWRRELATLLDARGPVPAAHLRALARLHDGEAAGLLVDALTAPKPLRDGYAQITVDHLVVRAFGSAAVPYLERAARGWRHALEGTFAPSFIPSVLRSPRLVSPVLDNVRVEVLTHLATRVRPPPAPGQAYANEQQPRELFVGTLVAIAARRPADAGRALVAVADRPSLLALALASFDPPQYTGYPYAADLDGTDAMLLEAWNRLPPSAPADSRAAIAAEAERLHVALPGMQSARPTSAEEALRELQRAMPSAGSDWPQPFAAPAATLRRISASGLAETNGRLALWASRLAGGLGEHAEAARLAELAVRLTPTFPERAAALLARADAWENAGSAARARADLEEALLHLGGASNEADVRTRLQALATVPPALRVRAWPPRGGGRGRGIETVDRDGRTVLIRDHLVYRVDFVRGGRRLVGVAPWDVRAAVLVGADAVAVLSPRGAVGLLREGHPGRVWRASTAASEDSNRPVQLVADDRTVLVRDGEGVVHGFDARTGRRRWAQLADASVPLALNGDEPVVLGLTGSSGHGVSELVGVDVQTGRTRWRSPVSGPLQVGRTGDGRAAWLLGDGTLTEVDLRTGRLRTSVALPQPRGAQPGVMLAFVPRSPLVVVALSDRLLLVDRGRIAWSRETPAASGSWTPLRVEVGDDGVIWRVIAGNGPVVAEAWTRDGEPIATYEVAKWAFATSVSMVAGRTLAIATGETAVLLDRVPQ